MRNMNIDLLVSLCGIRFDRGMGEYIRHFIGCISREFKDKVIFIYNDIIPKYILEDIVSHNSRVHVYNLPYPFVEQFIIPVIIRKYKVKSALFPANTFSILKPQNCKFIVVIHDLIFMNKDKNFLSLKQLIGRIYRRFIVKNFLRNIDMVVAVSENTATKINRYLNFSSERIHVIYNPFNLNIKIEPDFNILKILNINCNQYLYTITGSAPNKNLIFLIRSYKNVLHSFPDLKLVISGLKSTDIKKVKRLAKDLGIENMLLFTPYVTENEKIALLKCSKLFLFLSKDEGFGRPIIEALISGARVVASDIPIFREIGGKYIDFIDINSEFSLVNFLKNQHILEQGKLHTFAAELKQFLYSNFNSSIQCSKLISLLKESLI